MSEWMNQYIVEGCSEIGAIKEMVYRGRDMSVAELNALGRDLFYWYPPKPGVTIDATAGPREFVKGRRGK